MIKRRGFRDFKNFIYINSSRGGIRRSPHIEIGKKVLIIVLNLFFLFLLKINLILFLGNKVNLVLNIIRK